jgi:ATP-dependent exoDNAse (exonuclease V) alpha subunit
VRDGLIDEGVYEQLKTRFNGEINEEGIATKLYTHNRDVDAENMKELEKLAGDLYSYPMSSRGGDNLAATLKKGCLAPETLHLKEGARVMFVKNHFDGGYANGTLGVVEECSDFEIKVKTLAGKIIEVVPASWSIEENGKVKAEITQYPLRLAWAITVHKSQGMSLDAAEVDLSQSFEKGMGYVALSRVRTLAGLSLKGLNDTALKVHPEVLEYDRQFRIDSAEDSEKFRAKSPGRIDRDRSAKTWSRFLYVL